MKKWTEAELVVLNISRTASGGKAGCYEGHSSNNSNFQGSTIKFHERGDLQFTVSDSTVADGDINDLVSDKS